MSPWEIFHVYDIQLLRSGPAISTLLGNNLIHDTEQLPLFCKRKEVPWASYRVAICLCFQAHFSSDTLLIFHICTFFRGLTNLVDLDLSGNILSSVPTSAVEDCKYLMRLSLRANPIHIVGSDAFRGLHELVSLDLSDCGIEEIHADAFRGLDSLEYLRLEDNRLTTLSPDKSFPPNLRWVLLFILACLCPIESFLYQDKSKKFERIL